MTTLAPLSLSTVGTAGHAGEMLRRLVAPLRALAKAVQHRREVALLLNADAGMLRDLGLSQSDVACALAEPMWRDPSSRLLVWSIERRAAARAAAHDNLLALGRPAASARSGAPAFQPCDGA